MKKIHMKGESYGEWQGKWLLPWFVSKAFFKENKGEILKYIQLLITLFIVWY